MRSCVRLGAVVGALALLVGGVSAGTGSAVQLAQGQVVNPNPVNWTPHALNGQVSAVAQVGTTVVMGGTFTSVAQTQGGAAISRSYIAAFDATTGQLSTTFVPVLDGQVTTLAAAPDGQSVYVGGSFSRVGSVNAYKLARLRISDGAPVTAFKPQKVNAVVRDLKVNNNRLFIAGNFTKVGSTSRVMLAQLDAGTGALSPNLNVAFGGVANPNAVKNGQVNPEPTQVRKIDVSPDGSSLVVIGNFATVGGADREQVALLDLTSTPASVSSWQTDRYKPDCYSVFTDYVRDVEYSPDGSYFVVGTTGGYGAGPPTLCDTVTRWESGRSGSGQDPTWVSYTGGDSTYSVAPTGTAIYTGGHMRWQNDPFSADAAGPGAVPRTGIAALDPVNGLPLSWNPGRTRGQGVFDMLATPQGLWVGSDTDRLGGEYHAKIGFFPLAGGRTVPQPAVTSLPADVYGLGNRSPQTTGVLYRVNAGGPQLTAVDNGPDWQADSSDLSAWRNAGSSVASFSTLSATEDVPASTPLAVYDDERWDAGDAPEMQWAFPVEAGRNVQVRLYLANQYSGTAQVGQRVFNVALEGNVVLPHYDIVADVGDRVGTMKVFDITSDGMVNLDFSHEVENPLVSAIEIIDRDFVPPSTNPQDTVNKANVNDSGAATRTPPATGGVSWGQARGAFYAEGRLYTAWSDGQLYSRTFNGTSFGPATSLNLYGLAAFATEMQSMTGLFYDSGYIYFTLSGSSTLYRRAFTVESGVVGALRSNVTGGLPDLEWSQVGSMFRAGSWLYWADRSTGDLYRTSFQNGLPQSGSVKVSGPSTDGIDWRVRALFALPAS